MGGALFWVCGGMLGHHFRWMEVSVGGWGIILGGWGRLGKHFRSTILKVRLALSFWFFLVGYLLPLTFKLKRP